MKVSKLPFDPGPAGWNEILPDQGTAKQLEEDTTADWLIIGAGFAGLSAARRLSQLCPDNKIVVLEANRVAEGPAGRNSGFMIDLPHDLASDQYSGALQKDLDQTKDNRRAIEFAAEIAGEFHLDREAFDLAGKINGAASPRGLKNNSDFASHLKTMAEPHEFLGADQMREITGISYYQGGLYTPGTAIIQPASYIRALAQGLRSNRVTIYEDSPVIGLNKRGDWVATTPQGKLTAPRVILAVNGNLQSFGQMEGRLMHVLTYASMTRSLTPNETRRLGGEAIWGLTSADPLGTTVRRIQSAQGDRIVVRNRFTYEPTMEASPKTLMKVYQDHDSSFISRFPMLKGVGMEFRWGGRLCLSLNDVQIIKELEDNLWSACCQNGLGTVKGTLAGLLAAEAACEVTSPALERAIYAPLPKRLPPNPIAKLGADIRLKYGEVRAGKEL